MIECICGSGDGLTEEWLQKNKNKKNNKKQSQTVRDCAVSAACHPCRVAVAVQLHWLRARACVCVWIRFVFDRRITASA